MSIIDLMRTKTFTYEGPSDEADVNPLPVGLSRVTCVGGHIGIAFVDHVERKIVAMFSLDPGKRHVVNVPSGVAVVVECDDNVQWTVSYSNRFNKTDPTRVESTLIRPRTEQEEMADYLNEVAARAAGVELAAKMRSGLVDIDMENEDYAEHHEDDMHAPLTIYQMEGILSEIKKDLEREKLLAEEEASVKSENRDIEEEAPLVPLKDGKSKAGPKGKASKQHESDEVKQD